MSNRLMILGTSPLSASPMSGGTRSCHATAAAMAAIARYAGHPRLRSWLEGSSLTSYTRRAGDRTSPGVQPTFQFTPDLGKLRLGGQVSRFLRIAAQIVQ